MLMDLHAINQFDLLANITIHSLQCSILAASCFSHATPAISTSSKVVSHANEQHQEDKYGGGCGLYLYPSRVH